jgi:hypothetical protein
VQRRGGRSPVVSAVLPRSGLPHAALHAEGIKCWALPAWRLVLHPAAACPRLGGVAPLHVGAGAAGAVLRRDRDREKAVPQPPAAGSQARANTSSSETFGTLILRRCGARARLDFAA